MSMFDRASKVVELKRQPPKFSGKEEDWTEWKSRIQAVADLIDGGLPEAMQHALQVEESELERLEGPMKEFSNLWNGLLLDCCEGKALTIGGSCTTNTNQRSPTGS